MRTRIPVAARLALALAAGAVPALAQPTTGSSGMPVRKDVGTTTSTSRGETARGAAHGATTKPAPKGPSAAATRDTTSSAAMAPTSAASLAPAPTTALDPSAAGVIASMTSDAHAMGLLHAANEAEIQASSLAQRQARDAAVRAFAARMIEEHTALDQQGNALATRLGVTPMLPDSALPRLAAQEMATLTSAGASTSAAPMSAAPMSGAPVSGAPTAGMTTDSARAAAANPATSNAPTTSATAAPAGAARDSAAATTTNAAAMGGADFDRTYVGQQVADHQRTLALVDAAIARAQNAELRTALQSQVRPHVAAHLQEALQLQQRLGSR